MTRAEKELPELADSGLLGGSDIGPGVIGSIATLSDPKEIAQVLTSNFPEIGIQSDEKGNLLAESKT